LRLELLDFIENIIKTEKKELQHPEEFDPEVRYSIDLFDIIGDTSLLSFEREQEYLKDIADKNAALDKLERYNKKEIKLKREEIKELNNIIIKGEYSRDKLIEHNQRLVTSIAKNYLSFGISLDDLIQYGTIGLINAIDKFDNTRNTRLSTYAYSWINSSITRAIADKCRLIRIPIRTHEKAIAINKIERDLYQELSRKPTLEEIANKANIGLDELFEIKKLTRLTKSLDEQVGEDGEFIYYVPATEITPTESLMNDMLEELLKEIFNQHLTPYQEKIITLRYGIFDNKVHSLDEIAQIFDLPVSRIRYMETQALNILKDEKIKEVLKQFITF